MTETADMLKNLAAHCENGEHKQGVPGRLAKVLRTHGWAGPFPAEDADLSPALALAWIDEALPGWILEHLADNATGTVRDMRAIGSTCELSDGETTVQGSSLGDRHDYGIAFNRATAILVAGLLALAEVESRKALSPSVAAG